MTMISATSPVLAVVNHASKCTRHHSLPLDRDCRPVSPSAPCPTSLQKFCLCLSKSIQIIRSLLASLLLLSDAGTLTASMGCASSGCASSHWRPSKVDALGAPSHMPDPFFLPAPYGQCDPCATLVVGTLEWCRTCTAHGVAPRPLHFLSAKCAWLMLGGATAATSAQSIMHTLLLHGAQSRCCSQACAPFASVQQQRCATLPLS